MKTKIALLILLSLSSILEAHPVAYQGSVSVNSFNQPGMSDNWVVYSATPRWGLTARYLTIEGGNGGAYAFPQVNHLVMRKNDPGYQANFYLYGGFGGARQGNDSGTISLGGFQLDAENRRFYSMAQFEYAETSFKQKMQTTKLRLGAAPYESEFDEIGSWFILEFRHHPHLRRTFDLTPLARFYYKSVLWEIGVSVHGEYLTNFMFHF